MKRQEESYEEFLSQLNPVKTVIMKMVYSHKQVELENLTCVVQEMAATPLLRKPGINFCITRYSQHRNLQMPEEFTITQATVDLSRWAGEFTVGNQVISPNTLFENGLLSKLTLTGL